jgi:Phage tail baseplate hub (GPD)
MATSFVLSVAGGRAASTALTEALQSIEVEENADGPDAMTITLPVNRTSSGDLSYVDDGSFEPYTPVSVVLTAGSSTQCVFDGYVLSWRLHVDRVSMDSSIRIWAQDASWLMNLNDVVREWPGLTDGEVANEIFASYGISPAAGNLDDDSPAHLPEQHTLLQRATDLRFLHGLARRNGKICRVACGEKPGERTGYFIRPSAHPAVASISLVDPYDWSVDALDVDWDVMRPTQVRASQASFTAPAASAPAIESSSGIPVLGPRDLRSYAGRPSTTLLTATGDPSELRQRATAVLAESGWFATCTGEADLDRLGTVLRVGTVVTVDGAGSAHSGDWFVWRVNHLIERDSGRARFTLVRNAVGSSGGFPGGIL